MHFRKITKCTYLRPLYIYIYMCVCVCVCVCVCLLVGWLLGFTVHLLFGNLISQFFFAKHYMVSSIFLFNKDFLTFI